MKKLLLATTAFAGAVAFAQAASAQMTVTLGGNVAFDAGLFATETNDGDRRQFEFTTNSELVVRADGKADNGLTYGAYLEIEVDQDGDINGANANPGGRNNFTTDEVNIYVAGGWGRIELGDQDGASDVLSIYAPANYGEGGLDSEVHYWYFPNVPAFIGLNPFDSGDSTKITYYTPSFAGFQAGVSYAPQNASEGQDVNRNEFIGGAQAGYQDFVEAAVRYTGEFGDFRVGASATYNFAEATAANAAAATFEDLSVFGLGASVGFGGFTVGGAYYDAGESGLRTAQPSKEDTWGWNVGAEYATGPFLVGAQYFYSEAGVVGGVGAQELNGYSVGANYTVAPGLVTYVDAVWLDGENPGNVDYNGQVILVGTRVSF